MSLEECGTFTEGVTYYWCVNCGHSGKYGVPRFTGFVCQKCSYDEVTPYSKEEILEDDHLKFRFKEYFENTTVAGP